MSVSVLAGIFIRGIWIYVQNFRFLLRFPNVGFAWPLIGNAHKVMFLAREDRAPVARRLMEEADPRKRKVATVFGPNRMIWLFHPETAGKILGSNDIVTKSLEYKPLIPWLGEGLLVSGGEKWRRRRKQLTPAFHFSILEDCMATFNRNADLLCDILIEDGLGGKETLDLFPYVCRCTLDIILESAMGRSIGVQKSRGTGDQSPGAGYARALSEIVELITQRQITPWLYPDFLFSLSEVKRRQDKCLEVLRGFTRGVIRERKKELGVVADESGSHKKKRLAFLDLLLQTDPPLDEKDLQDEVDTFTFGGHDTTGCAISWALLLLANNPEVQNRARLEQEEIFGDDDFLEAEASMEDLAQMKYLEACIKEALRLYPSVPIVGRMLEKDVFIDGELVPEGTEAIVPIFILHRNSGKIECVVFLKK